jgi:hypothetical protein
LQTTAVAREPPPPPPPPPPIISTITTFGVKLVGFVHVWAPDEENTCTSGACVGSFGTPFVS